MGKESMTLRDLFASVVSGTTLNVSTSTATDFLRSVIDDSGAPALRVSGSFGTSGGSGTSGVSGTSGTSGDTGASGSSGVSGDAGTSGSSGTSGDPLYDASYYYDSGTTTLFVPTIDTSDVIKSAGYQSRLTSTDQSNFYMTNYDSNDNFIVGNSNALSDSTNYSAIYMTTGDTMTLTGNVSILGTISMGASVGINGSFYASTTSGGTTDTLFTFVNGILVANP